MILLYAKGKSGMSFQLLPKSATLNGVMAVILCYFAGFTKKTSYFCFHCQIELVLF